jgi:hypothetical protein
VVAGNSQQSQWTSPYAPGILSMMPFITTGRIHSSSSSSSSSSCSSRSSRSARISTSKVGSIVVEAKEYPAITTWAPLHMPHIQRRCMSEIASLHRSSSSATMITDGLDQSNCAKDAETASWSGKLGGLCLLDDDPSSKRIISHWGPSSRG